MPAQYTLKRSGAAALVASNISIGNHVRVYALVYHRARVSGARTCEKSGRQETYDFDDRPYSVCYKRKHQRFWRRWS